MNCLFVTRLTASFLMMFSLPVLAQYQFHQRVDGLTAQDNRVFPESCKSIIDSGNAQGDGVYTIYPNGGSALEVYCDLTTDGGGWTLVVAQFENDPVENWNEGAQADYDPSLLLGKGFALSSSEIPGHTSTAFSRGLSAGEFEQFDIQYSTSDIPLTLLQGKLTGKEFYIHRNENSYYWNHDVGEDSLEPDVEGSRWGGTMAVDQKGGWFADWAFSPSIGPDRTTADIGFAFKGERRVTLEPYAWTIWVR
jgi:hypothetical protein